MPAATIPMPTNAGLPRVRSRIARAGLVHGEPRRDQQHQGGTGERQPANVAMAGIPMSFGGGAEHLMQRTSLAMRLMSLARDTPGMRLMPASLHSRSRRRKAAS